MLYVSESGAKVQKQRVPLFVFPSQAEMDLVAWGVDLASVEQHINSHRSIHNAIGDYRWQLDKIKADLVLFSVSF